MTTHTETSFFRPDPPIGLGTMPIAIQGRPDRATAKAVIQSAVEAGIRLIDTADAYALDDSETGYCERLVAEALRDMGLRPEDGPAGDVPLIATKGGMRRPEGRWVHAGRPEHLRAACEASLGALGLDVIPLYQLHNKDPEVPFEESVGALARLREEGKIRLVGLSNVSVGDVERARKVTPIVSVQNAFSVWDVGYRRSPALGACERHNLVLLAHSPFGGADRAPALSTHEPLQRVSADLGVSPYEATLAWLLSASRQVVPIPGTTRPDRVTSWLRAAELKLSGGERRRLTRAYRRLPGHRGLVARAVGKVRRLLLRRGASIALASLALAPLSLMGCGSPPVVPQPDDLGVIEVAVSPSPCTAPSESAADPPTGIRVDTLATGLTVPWDVAFAADGRAFLTERPGRIRVLSPEGRMMGAQWIQLNVYAEGEVGLMGVDVRPGDHDGLELYVAATHRTPPTGVVDRLLRGALRRLVRAFDPERGHPTTLRVLRIRELDGRVLDPQVVVEGLPAFMLHGGGALRFGPDGLLYLTNGDGAEPWTAHDPESPRGKILRYQWDGTPAGIVSESAVFARGIRHVQGLAWHPETGELFAIDHGPTGLEQEKFRSDRDELNVVEGGDHLGWPIVTGVTRGGGLRSALFQWTPAIAPAGLAIVDNADSPWFGDAFVTGLRGRTLQRIELRSTDQGAWTAFCGEVLVHESHGRLRLVRAAPDGSLWVGTSNADGRGVPREGGDVLLRVRPEGR